MHPILLLTWLTLAATGTGGTIIATAPANSDPALRYVFYLHGRIIEDQGERPTDPRFGVYELAEIRKALATPGTVLISETRPKNTDMQAYAAKVTREIAALLSAGVPADHVTVVGFSKGGGIAIRVAALVANPDVRYVFLACCSRDSTDLPDLHVSGKILSIHEASDDYGGTCRPLVAKSNRPVVFEEIELRIGHKHGAFYAPYPEWIEPTLRWIH